MEIAKTLSKGKDWTVEEITHVRNEDIHTNSSYLLQIALGLEAGDVSSTDPYLAAKLSERAAIIAETGRYQFQLIIDDPNYITLKEMFNQTLR